MPAPAQEAQGLDYECELVVVIGKEGKDIPESQALEYVLGYTVGNDVSHREWQFKRGGSQWGLGKGYVLRFSDTIFYANNALLSR